MTTIDSYPVYKCIMSGWKSFFGFEEEETSSLEAEFNKHCSCSYTTRIYGFVACFALGWLVTFLSLVTVVAIATHPEKFAVMYTFGNIISLCSTMFLFGPCSQLKSMFAKKRVIWTILYLFSIGLTLFCAYKVQSVLAVLLCLLLELIALLLYSLSYIPYAHTCLLNCGKSVLPC